MFYHIYNGMNAINPPPLGFLGTTHIKTVSSPPSLFLSRFIQDPLVVT